MELRIVKHIDAGDRQAPTFGSTHAPLCGGDPRDSQWPRRPSHEPARAPHTVGYRKLIRELRVPRTNPNAMMTRTAAEIAAKTKSRCNKKTNIMIATLNTGSAINSTIPIARHPLETAGEIELDARVSLITLSSMPHASQAEATQGPVTEKTAEDCFHAEKLLSIVGSRFHGQTPPAALSPRIAARNIFAARANSTRR